MELSLTDAAPLSVIRHDLPYFVPVQQLVADYSAAAKESATQQFVWAIYQYLHAFVARRQETVLAKVSFICLLLLVTRDVSYTFISTSGSRRNLEPKWAENLQLQFASSAHLPQQTEQKAKIVAERWRHWVNICYEKVVLSEYNSASIINLLKTSNVEVICVCFAGCY